MSPLRWLGPALLVLGVALVIAAVATGAARLVLVVVIPVFVGGTSPLFLGGIVALFGGLLLLPLTFGGAFELDRSESEPTEGEETPRAGGLVLIGPVPIFFGAWKRPTQRTVWIAVAIGAALLVLAVALSGLLR
ncbi:MAG: DUF131 domain-containing protein [Thermoplasmata archaeon]|nr:DUF131 domain-containing protein [Thermoplasmata archaeon]